MLYELPQDKMAAPHLAAQTRRIFGSCPDSEFMLGNLYRGGSVFQFTACAQALLQLLVRVWFSPTAPQ